MTVDMGHGTIQMSGLYEDLMSECQLLSEPRLAPHRIERSASSAEGSLDSARSARGFDHPESRILPVSL